MPSDVLDSLAFCKNILSIEKVRIGGYTLPTLIPHLTVNIGELIISLPFLYIMMMIIFWYAEMFVILLSAYIVIPVCTLSELNISSIRKIMRSLVLQGMKLFAGIFIANMATNIVLKSVEKLEGSITSTSNTVIFCIFMTLVIFFLILKAPNAMINAVNGETEKTGSSLISGAIGGGIAALGAALPAILGNKKNDGKRMPQPYSPTGGMPTPSGNASNPNASGKAGKASSGADAKQHSAQNKNVPETSERIANDNAKQSNGARYGEVTVRATPGRMEAAKTELMNEGVENITESMIKDRAIRDAKIEKLVKMEKNGFMTQNNEFNKPAFEQLQRLRDGRE
ncbi:MAG TPA: hypothetical protein DCO86_05245 [Spirochaetaceae bacterium]|nr:hypothetical protein [Spirochaetaceae bacterium]